MAPVIGESEGSIFPPSIAPDNAKSIEALPGRPIGVRTILLNWNGTGLRRMLMVRASRPFAPTKCRELSPFPPPAKIPMYSSQA
jgi:hypothetical protein